MELSCPSFYKCSESLERDGGYGSNDNSYTEERMSFCYLGSEGMLWLFKITNLRKISESSENNNKTKLSIILHKGSHQKQKSQSWDIVPKEGGGTRLTGGSMSQPAYFCGIAETVQWNLNLIQTTFIIFKEFLIIVPYYLLGALPLVLSMGATITLTQDPTCVFDSSLSGNIEAIDALLSITMLLFQIVSLLHWTSQSWT